MKALIITAALTLAAGAAYAQGAPLLLPAQAATPAQAARLEALNRQPGIAKVTPMTIDPNALNSNVISVTLGRKTYVFVGEREKVSAEHESWASTDKTSGNGAALVRGPNGVSGSIRADGVDYNVEPGLLIQNSAPSRPMTVVNIKPAASTPVDPNKAGRTK